jgi:hypothetical protein
MFEEPDALMRARPDLWEPWESNLLGPPGQPSALNGYLLITDRCIPDGSAVLN